jgi:hypothetical protein
MKVPVLLIVYNRDQTLNKVLESLMNVGVEKLYIASDGPNKNKLRDEEKVKNVRVIIKKLKWKCDVQYLIREENCGCKMGVSTAIDWFFNYEDSGIILEDDCIPNESFWTFCEIMLDKYKHDERVMTISGTNSQDGTLRGDASYYFSKYNHVWGWATWKRAWNFYDGNISFWPEMRKTDMWINKFQDQVERHYWEDIFDEVYNSSEKWDAWDYPWTCCIWRMGGLNIMPNYNLVSNIGFGPDATHTKSIESEFSNNPTSVVKKFKLLKEELIAEDSNADAYTFKKHFGGEGQRTFKYIIKRKLKKLINRLRSI